MSLINWAQAPAWAGCVIKAEGDGCRLFWAEPWGTRDGMRMEVGRSTRTGMDFADTSKPNGWTLVEVKPWDGEGLPPVGTVCEFAGFNPEETLPSDPMVGDRVTVIAHFKSGSLDVAAFTFFAPPEFEYLQVAQGAYGCFRPIRTPEQIAAEEREVAICAMMEVCSELPCRQSCADLYDAGYRKQKDA